MILPEVNENTITIDTDLTEQKPVTKTYAVIGNRIQGTTDGRPAIEQAIDKIIQTERFQYIIYSWNYGIELFDLYGTSNEYVLADVQRRFEEALLQNLNILNISNFEAKIEDKSSISISFTADTEFGDIFVEREVMLNGIAD